MKTNPPSARPKKKVKYIFAGFKAGKAIYGHNLHKGKVAETYKFGKAKGPCGVLKAKARIYPGHSRYSHYKAQFDNSKKYSKKASPRINTTVSVLRF